MLATLSAIAGILGFAVDVVFKLIGLRKKEPAQEVDKVDHAMLDAAVNRPDDAAVDQRLRDGNF